MYIKTSTLVTLYTYITAWLKLEHHLIHNNNPDMIKKNLKGNYIKLVNNLFLTEIYNLFLYLILFRLNSTIKYSSFKSKIWRTNMSLSTFYYPRVLIQFLMIDYSELIGLGCKYTPKYTYTWRRGKYWVNTSKVENWSVVIQTKFIYMEREGGGGGVLMIASHKFMPSYTILVYIETCILFTRVFTSLEIEMLLCMI